MKRVTVIIGPPCSGKSTYAWSNATDNDLVWDYDRVLQATTTRAQNICEPHAGQPVIARLRTTMIQAAANEEAIEVLYVTCAKVTDALLKSLDGLSVEEHHMEATKEECLERLESDDTRPDKEAWRELIEQYFEDEQEREARTMNSKIEERIKAGIQYRDAQNVVAVAPEEGEAASYIVEGYASTFMPYTLLEDDEYRIIERIDPAAFADADLSDVIFQYNHEGRVYARTRNNTLAVSADSEGLFIHADLGGTEEGRKLHEEIRGGYTDRMSFAFTSTDDVWSDPVLAADGKREYNRTIRKIRKVYDVSAVSLPANDDTSISARSAFDWILERERKAAERAAKVEKLKTMIKEVLKDGQE